jgi:hypothetical protein
LQPLTDIASPSVEPGFADIDADPAMFRRYTPVPGDRYMVYEDGYKSFSPKKAFEDGYEALQNDG